MDDNIVELLAQDIHEFNRQAVEQHKVVYDLGIPFQSWDEISEEAKEGRRLAAKYLLSKYSINIIQSYKHAQITDPTDS